ncbi:MAG: ThuA domain-containing protein [Draconibacterium sp.]
MKRTGLGLIIILLLFLNEFSSFAQKKVDFSVIAFYTGKNDKAHISFVGEANSWFSEMGKKHHFVYDSTNDWNKMTTDFLEKYDVVIFLDTRPDSLAQREAFEKYMKKGGAWMGFHFCAFALTPSAFQQDWDWYHTEFLGSGQYKSNTWRPTSAILKVEDKNHPTMKGLPQRFKASPNEWYRWEKDLRENPDIKILASIDPESFPLGTGPKQYEIWHEGYYPVVWTNVNYRMIYINMGHNDIDYEGGTNNELSKSFENEVQNKMIINALFWLGKEKIK